MEKDTLGKMIDLYVEKELETQFNKLAQNFLDLLYMFEHYITYDKKLDTYVFDYDHYVEIKRAIIVFKQKLKEHCKVESKEVENDYEN